MSRTWTAVIDENGQYSVDDRWQETVIPIGPHRLYAYRVALELQKCYEAREAGRREPSRIDIWA